MGRERKRSLLPALRAPSPGTLAFLNGWAGLLRVRELLCVIIMRHHYASLLCVIISQWVGWSTTCTSVVIIDDTSSSYVYECSDH